MKGDELKRDPEKAGELKDARDEALLNRSRVDEEKTTKTLVQRPGLDFESGQKNSSRDYTGRLSRSSGETRGSRGIDHARVALGEASRRRIDERRATNSAGGGTPHGARAAWSRIRSL